VSTGKGLAALVLGIIVYFWLKNGATTPTATAASGTAVVPLQNPSDPSQQLPPWVTTSPPAPGGAPGTSSAGGCSSCGGGAKFTPTPVSNPYAPGGGVSRGGPITVYSPFSSGSQGTTVL
jgi:hypothetical protein